jgi:hypothetical protein
VRIHLAAEHAPELQRAHGGFQPRDFLLDVGDGRGIVLGLGQLEQLAGIGKLGSRGIELGEVGNQPGAFASQFLRAFGVVPDILLFELADDFLQAFLLRVVVKETPGGSWPARKGRAGSS